MSVEGSPITRTRRRHALKGAFWEIVCQLLLTARRGAKTLRHCSKNLFQRSNAIEGGVVEGIVVAIEKDVAVIDVGLKTEGRVPLKEFLAPGKDGGSRSATRSRFISTASRTRSAKR